jgi:hypothetical protein
MRRDGGFRHSGREERGEDQGRPGWNPSVYVLSGRRVWGTKESFEPQPAFAEATAGFVTHMVRRSLGVGGRHRGTEITKGARTAWLTVEVCLRAFHRGCSAAQEERAQEFPSKMTHSLGDDRDISVPLCLCGESFFRSRSRTATEDEPLAPRAQAFQNFEEPFRHGLSLHQSVRPALAKRWATRPNGISAAYGPK